MSIEYSTVSWIAKAEEALGLAKNANEAQRQFTGLEDASGNLSALLVDFRALAAGASIVRPFGWEGKFPHPELVNDLEEARKTLGTRPLARSVNALERFKSDVKNALIEQWRQHAVERMGDVTELQTLAGTLSEVEDVAELSRRLEVILGELARTQKEVPSPRTAELLRDAELILRELEESLQPESVRRFLSAVARGGASIELLNKAVIDWLNAHKALPSFRIVAGAPTNEAHV